MISSWTK